MRINKKVIFFNPITLKKRVTKFMFQWDYSNHCWSVTVDNYNPQTYYGDPTSRITNYITYTKRVGEYVTIK